MAKNANSTLVNKTVRTYDDQDRFPVFEAQDGKGNFRPVLSLAERDSIYAERRQEGMLVYVKETDTFYTLAADLVTWRTSMIQVTDPSTYFGTLNAGLAETESGDYFVVADGDGLKIYFNDGGGGDLRFTFADQQDVANAEGNAALARRYATEDEDVEVEDGTYSSKHYSVKSEEQADRAEDEATEAAVQADRSEAEADRAEAASASAQASARTYAEWDDGAGGGLVNATGSVDGEGAEVLDSDTGTHSAASGTGYDGGSVDNGGRYSWSSAWSRWVRIGGTGLAGVVGRLDAGDVADLLDGAQIGLTGDLTARDAIIQPPGLQPGSGVANRTAVPHQPCTIDGWVSLFAVLLESAEPGRNVNFYVLRSDGGDDYTVVYDSGPVSAEDSGTFTFSPADFTAKIGVNDYIAVYSDEIGVSLRSDTLGSPITSAMMGPMSFGAQYTLDNSVSNRSTPVAALVQPRVVLSTAASSGVAGGIATLDSTARLPPRVLPESIIGNSANVRVVGDEEVIVEDGLTRIVSRGSASVSEYSVLGIDYTGSATVESIADRTFVSYEDASPGFAQGGTLTELRLPGFVTDHAGNVVSAWVVRPIDLPNGRFTVVAHIGDIAAEVACDSVAFRDLDIPVDAGDMIAIRGSAAMRTTASTAITGFTSISVKSHSALDGLSELDAGAYSASGSQIAHHEADIRIGSRFSAPNQAGSFVQTTTANYIPPGIAREIDLPHAGLTIGFVGTSITSGGAASSVENRYVSRVAKSIGATVVNQGVSSSGISTGTYAALSKTIAESGELPQHSYENLILGQGFDILVIDHGFNDKLRPIGTVDSTDRNQIAGAYNYVIEQYFTDNPSGRCALITPPTAYGGDGGFVDELRAVADIIGEIGLRWGCPVLDLTNRGPFGVGNSAAHLADGVHPNDEGHRIIANVIYKFLSSMV